jgi:hypothetical protein
MEVVIVDYRRLLSIAILLMSLSANPVKAQIEQPNLANSARRIDVTLKTPNDQTFNELIQQAEIQAISLIEQEFVTNSSITEIAVTILGDRQGQQVPLLFSRVSRSDWQLQPIISQWTKYFPTSAVLLGFNQPQTTPPQQAQSAPVTPVNQCLTPTTPSNSIPAATPTPNNTPPTSGGASLEETDPGYR